MSVDLSPAQWGEGPRNALLIHGLTSNAALWWRLAPEIAALGYTVHAVDLRGHGLSPRTESYEIGAYTDDVLAVPGAPWDLVLGHSLGGAIAITAMTREPGFAQRLILMDPLVLPRDLEPDEVMERYLEPFTKPLTTDTVAADNPNWHRGDIERKAESLQQASTDMVRGTVLHNKGWNAVDAAKSLAVPTLILGADPDLEPLVPPELGNELAKANRNIDYVAVAGGSHSMHRDRFEDTWAIMSAWLARVGET